MVSSSKSSCRSACRRCKFVHPQSPSIRKGWWTFAPPILSHSQERRFLLRFPGLSEMFIPQISSLPSPKWKPLNYFINAGGRSSLGWVASSNSIGIMILVKEVASSTSELKLVHLYVQYINHPARNQEAPKKRQSSRIPDIVLLHGKWHSYNHHLQRYATYRYVRNARAYWQSGMHKKVWRGEAS